MHMREDYRSIRTAFPTLLPGAMFILPLAVVCNAGTQALPRPTAPKTTASAGPMPGAKAPKSSAPQSGALPASAPQAPISPGSGGKEVFNVQFQETDIAQALQMLSIQGQRNIITGKNVSGTVTANLFDVTVTEALDVILKALDLRYEETGNFIYVYTREEWEQMQLARRKRESRRFSLEYLNPKDANEFVAPLLSDTGKVAYVGNVEKGIATDLGNVGEDTWAFQGMLVVNDYPENLQSIADLLADVDTPPTQVAVESTIVSTRVNEDNAFGVDFTVIGDVDFTDFVNPLGVVNNLIQGNNTPGAKGTDKLGFQPSNNQAQGISSTVGQTGKPGGLKVGVISDNVSVFLRVLDEVTDSLIIARPRVLALNRQRAQILVGERIGYLSTTSTQTTTTQTVQFLDTGVKLVFRPFIARDGSIRMELAPSVSEATLRSVTTDEGGGQIIPDEKTSEVTTNVRVKDGQTLVIGGLYQETTTMNRRQVPGIGDVPILGAAFRGQDDKIERREIIFLITPTIMKDAIAQVWGKEGIEFAEAVRIGAREGTLPFSRDRLTANHNQKALDAIAAGDTELALHHTESSLSLNHNQPEMNRLRHQLDETQPNRVFERDMMRSIMTKYMEAGGFAANQPASPPAAASDPLAEPVGAQSPEESVVPPTQTAAVPDEVDAGESEATSTSETSAQPMSEPAIAPMTEPATEPKLAAPEPLVLETSHPVDEHCDDAETNLANIALVESIIAQVDDAVFDAAETHSRVVIGPEDSMPGIESAEVASLGNVVGPFSFANVVESDVVVEASASNLSPNPLTTQGSKYFIEVFSTNQFLKPWFALLHRGSSDGHAYANASEPIQSNEP